MNIIEAVTKWCPFSRGVIVKVLSDPATGANSIEPGLNSTIGPLNRYVTGSDLRVEPPEGCKCLANGCMAWRWNEVWAILPVENWPKTEGGSLTLPTGYCGLAGKDGAGVLPGG